MIGKTLGDFTIREWIGSGGMGKVYLAFQNSLERKVALKVISLSHFSSDKENTAVERFLREARIAASLQHPNIVAVYSAGREGNTFYIAMEFIAGESLEARIGKGRIAESQGWEFGLQVCRGLRTALENGVIHRDIKPANILLASNKIAKLTDFGLSKRMDDENQLTQAGVILGTPNYISPEQASGENVDFRSDIYSLGATLYHVLTGEILFRGDILGILWKHKFEPVILPQEHVPDLRSESSAILGKMLQKDPQDRYQSYSDLIVDIEALFAGEPLRFANDESAFSVYNRMPTPPKYTTRKMLSSLAGMLGGSGKAKAFSAILVTGLSQSKLEEALGKSTAGSFELATVTSIEELKVRLAQKRAPILLDSDYLGVRTADFCGILRRLHPDIPVGILVDSDPIPDAPRAVLVVPHGGREEMIAEFLSAHLDKPESLFRSGIDLDTILFLARHLGWSATLKVNPGAQDEGSIVLSRGEITQARQKQLKGSMAVSFLKQNDRSWVSDAEESTAGANPAKDFSIAKRVPSNPTVSQTFQSHADEENSGSRTTTIFSNSNFPHWKALVAHDDMAEGTRIVETLNNTGSVMALCVDRLEDAVSMLYMDRFDVVVSKAKMARPDGIPFYREVGQIFPGIRQIILGEISQDLSKSITSSLQIAQVRSNAPLSEVAEIIFRWQKSASW